MYVYIYKKKLTLGARGWRRREPAPMTYAAIPGPIPAIVAPASVAARHQVYIKVLAYAQKAAYCCQEQPEEEAGRRPPRVQPQFLNLLLAALDCPGSLWCDFDFKKKAGIQKLPNFHIHITYFLNLNYEANQIQK